MRYPVPEQQKFGAVDSVLNQMTKFLSLWNIWAMMVLNIRCIIDIIFIKYRRENISGLLRTVDGNI